MNCVAAMRGASSREDVGGTRCVARTSAGPKDAQRRAPKSRRSRCLTRWQRPRTIARRTPSRMQLLVAVINHEEKVDDVLAGFLELGITGATIVGSEGMGRVLSHDVPIFAGVRSLTARSR